MQDFLPFLGETKSEVPGVRRMRRRSLQSRHLLEARRLAREIRRVPPGSKEQTLVGQRICRHLIAMLQEPGSPPVSGA
jgi:hypothetical protein